MSKMKISEKRLLIEHDKEGYKRYGKKKWEIANIGWGSSETGIASKIYGKPTMVLESSIVGNKIIHTETKY